MPGAIEGRHKIRFVLGHPVSGILGDEREGIIARHLRKRGHDAAIVRARYVREPSGRNGPFNDLLELFPVDDDAADPKSARSTALLDALRRDAPDVLVVKGMDYCVIHDAINLCRNTATIIAVVAGSISDRNADEHLHFLFEEYEGQIEPFSYRFKKLVGAATLPKLVEVDTSASNAKKIFDIVNVGTFDEQRKNQELLLPLARKYNICFVGGGSRLEDFNRLSAHYDRPIKFTGYVLRPTVLDCIRHSRLMVHTSLWEGFPRAIAESLACGVPVVAHSAALGRAIDGSPWGLTADEFDLYRVIRDLLHDDERLARMSRAAIKYATANYSEENVVAQFVDGLDFALGVTQKRQTKAR